MISRLLLLTLLTSLLFVPNAHAGKEALSRYVEGQVLVKFKSQATTSSRRSSLTSRGHEATAPLADNALVEVRVAEGQTVEEAVAAYAGDPNVEFAQPNFIYTTHRVPDDAMYGQLWGLKNSGQTIASIPNASHTARTASNPGTAGKDMALEAAWDILTDCSSVIVAVVDSGVNYEHEDLAENMWDGGAAFPHHGYNFADKNDDPRDDTGHGSHVAGTIAAVGNNGLGSTGLCWKAKIMAVKVAGATNSAFTSNIVKGVDFAVEHGAKVLNISLGGAGFDPAFEAAIARAAKAEVVVVVSAGNDGANNDSGTTPTYPCNYDQKNIVCVAALDQSYNLASFSNYGTKSVDIAAPGVNVASEWAGAVDVLSPKLDTGWTMATKGSGAGWSALNFGTAKDPYYALADPSNYLSVGATYGKNLDDRVFKAFDLTGADVVTVSFDTVVNTEPNKDHFSFWCKGDGGDPADGGTLLEKISGRGGSSAFTLTYDMSGCASPTTTFGFQFTSDNKNSGDRGVAAAEIDFKLLSYDKVSYDVIAGTSMSSPHVAGLAAMILAQNPAYGYADVIESIKSGGVDNPSQKGKTVVEKAASAHGSLTYLQAPTGLTATK